MYKEYKRNTNIILTYYEYNLYCRRNDENIAFFIYFRGYYYDANTIDSVNA